MEEENSNLYAKTRECRNRQHINCTDSRQLERCGYYHSEDDRWVVIDGKRRRWTPRLEGELFKKAAERQRQYEVYQVQRRAEWIAKLKAQPKYKTSACQIEEEHDHETCGFSHGYDFNFEGAKLLQEQNARRRAERAMQAKPPSRNQHASERRRKSFNATQHNDNTEAYDAAFPSLVNS